MPRKSYSISFKNSVLEYLQSHSGEQTAKHFKIDARRIRVWKKQKEQIRALMKQKRGNSKRLEGGGRKIIFPEAEEQLLEFIREKREGLLRVSRKAMVMKARELFAEHKESDAIACNASNGWLHAFLKRNTLSVRRRTAVSQKDPEDFAAKIVSFILYVEKLRSQHKFEAKNIIAMDETGVNFDMLNSTTVAPTGSKDVTLRCTGQEKNDFTVVLAARGDGTKLKPTIVFKNGARQIATLKKKEMQAHVTCSSNGWMNEELIQDWIEKVLGTSLFQKRLLVWDSYKAHLTDKVKRLLRSKNTVMAVVPGGCTKYLQAPDVSWNKPFKAYIREKYDEWMAGSDNKEYTKARGNCPGGNLKPPNKEIIVKWVVDAWQSLSESLVRDSFKTCALTTTVGGNEDELIHCLKPGKPCRSAWELLQKSRDEGEAADLAIVVEDFATQAPSQNYQDDEDSSSDEVVEDIDESSEESDAECDDDEPFSDDDHPWIDTNQ